MADLKARKRVDKSLNMYREKKRKCTLLCDRGSGNDSCRVSMHVLRSRPDLLRPAFSVVKHHHHNHRDIGAVRDTGRSTALPESTNMMHIRDIFTNPTNDVLLDDQNRSIGPAIGDAVRSKCAGIKGSAAVAAPRVGRVDGYGCSSCLSVSPSLLHQERKMLFLSLILP